MESKIKNKILIEINQLDSKIKSDKVESTKLLNQIYVNLTDLLSIELNKKKTSATKKISLGKVKQDYNIRFGVKRQENEIIFADWLLNLQPRTRSNILAFILIKESLLNFFTHHINDEDEIIFNIISIILYLELTNIKTIVDSPIASITGKIYQDEVAGLNFYYFYNLLFLLTNNNISFNTVLKKYDELFTVNHTTPKEKISAFAKWVFSITTKDENRILPIFTNQKLINLIELLLELGHENANTTFVAKKLNLTRKTITKWFKALNENFSTYWRADINYEEMNLHNYFIKIQVESNTSLEKLKRELLQIPYLKTLYQGSNDKNNILYCPSLIGPHIVSENLNERLRKLTDKKTIQDYNVKLVREKYRYFAISNFPYKPKISTFENLINEGDSYLRKFIFSHEKRSSFLPSSDKDIIMDYSLLYFLSILKSKFLLKARYGVRMNEFKDFYTKKGIELTDVDAQQALLYQNELRAKRKGLLSFSLWMTNFGRRGPDILIFDIPKDEISEKKLAKIIQNLRIFSYMGQINLYDRYIFQVPGISHKHPIKDIIQNFLEKNGINKTDFYSIRFLGSKYVPLQDLYDYDDQKWKIADF